MPKINLTQEDWEKIGRNTLRFIMPTLGVFFGQLALGVEFNNALPVALLALYQSISDILGKNAKRK